jgi:hypothetical protein
MKYFFAALMVLCGYMAVFSIKGDSPADEPAWHLAVLWGIGAWASARAAYRRFTQRSARPSA